jgi:hypothetical protein
LVSPLCIVSIQQPAYGFSSFYALPSITKIIIIKLSKDFVINAVTFASSGTACAATLASSMAFLALLSDYQSFFRSTPFSDGIFF